MNDKRDVIDNLNELAQVQPSAAAVEQAIEKTRAALNARLAELAAQPIATVPFWRGFLIRPRNLIATAAAAILIVLATQWLATSSNGNIAFAQVQEQVAKTKSVQYKQLWTEESADGKSIVQNTSKVQIVGDKLKREEFETDTDSPFGSYIMIRDLNKQAELILYPKVKAFGLTAAPPALTDAYLPANEPDHGATAPPVVDGESSAKGENTFRASRTSASEKPADNSKHSTGENAAVLQPSSGNDKSWDVSPVQPDFKYSDETAAAPKKSTDTAGVTAKSATADWTFTTNIDANLKPEPHLDIFALVQRVPTDNVKRLPEKFIDGKKAVGFQLDETTTNKFGKTIWQHTWWVDPATKLPVRLEVTFHGDDQNNVARVIDERIISDIVFNAPIEQSLFSLDPPKDYRPLEVVAQEMYPPKASGPASKKTEFVFADVQEEVEKTKTVQYTAICNRSIGKNPVPEFIVKTMILGPYLKREETTLKDPSKLDEAGKWGVEPNVAIHNVKTGEFLSYWAERKMFAGPQNMGSVYVPKENEKPSQKEIDAAKARSDKWLKDPRVDFYDEIRRFPESKATKLPEKTLDGKRVVGFLLDLGKADPSHKVVATITYWIDTETKLPVQIEHVNHTDKEMGLSYDTVLRDIVFDEPLDESLFSFTPPKGYTEMGKMNGSANPATPPSKPGR